MVKRESEKGLRESKKILRESKKVLRVQEGFKSPSKF